MKGGGSREVSPSSPVWPASSSWKERASVWASSENRIPDVKCLHPYIAPGRIAWPCGRCPSCRSNRRRIWTHRIMLEALQHEENSFITLTYAPDREPVGLDPGDLQGWLKRLRERVSPRRLRYYCVGEYRSGVSGPHYHGAIFGLGCSRGPIRLVQGGGWRCECLACTAVRDSWTFGHVMVGTLEERSAAYIAGYVLKKMNTTWDISCGLQKPFARMSLKPGIGAGAIPDVASAVMQWKLEERGDVPVGLRHGGTVMPLGRYLRNQLRAQCGLPEGCPEEVIEAYRQGLLPVFQYADAVAHRNPSAWRAATQYAFEEVNAQENRNIAARSMRKEKL